jgi:predicted small secreted protein
LTLALLVAAAPMLSACNTTRGAGEDLSAAGHGIEKAADRNTRY